MAGFPSPNGFGSNRENNNGDYIIINGRRVPVGNGIHGRDFAKVAGPGRRPVKIGSGRNDLLDPSKFYSPADLTDKYGRPVKISSIPDRTKGDVAASEKVLVFLDFANINAAAGGIPLPFDALLGYLGEGRFLKEAYAYVPIDPRRPEARRGLVRALQEAGWMVYQKMGKIAGDSYKSNVDVEMCIDIMRSAQNIKPDIMVLCSGDGDFVPVIRELRRMGIRVEVASFDCAADSSLRYEASGFISLDLWREEMEQGNDPLAADESELDIDVSPKGYEDFFQPRNSSYPDLLECHDSKPDSQDPASND